MFTNLFYLCNVIIMKKYKVLFFDTDGTLLDTLQDILEAVNFALRKLGYQKQYNYEEGKTLIGGGAYVLAKRAISFTKVSEEQYQEYEETFFRKYLELQDQSTKPYPGMIELLKKCQKKYQLFVVSNKPQIILDDIIQKMFPKDTFIELGGHRPNNPEKPDPILINEFVKKYHLQKEECLMIGDSHTDIETAINAGVDSLLVTYGYGFYTDELKKKATYVANSIDELSRLLDD